MVSAFEKHNLISGAPPGPVIVRFPKAYRPANEYTTLLVKEALRKTKNNSSPGPDRIPYRLIKLIQDTNLGEAVINDIARIVDGEATIQPEM